MTYYIMSKEPKLSYYIDKANSLDKSVFEKKIRAALLCSFTLNGLEETLCVKCADKKIECMTYVSGYNQYAQDILDPKSKLYQFSPDVSFLILDTRSMLGHLFYTPYSLSVSQRKEFVEKKKNEIISLVKSFTKVSKSKLVITNFGIPTHSPYGICESKTEYGLQDMVRDLNSKLTSDLQTEPSVYVYDFNGFITRHGEVNVFDYRQFLFGDIKVALDFIPNLAEDLMGYIKAILGVGKKCIVLDLDDTLWGGIVGEDGFNGIELGPTAPGNAFVEFQRVLISLYQRGIILVINSKNNPEDALQVIREHPYMVLREENFASLKINWNDKVSNMREIADELNIGLDSMVFFDDDPVNRDYLKTTLPEVLTIDLPKDFSKYAAILSSMNDFNVLKITDEDAKRGDMYVQQKKRQELEKTAPNMEDFLKQLDIKILIRMADQFTIPRISQLTLKTNQFNLTTRRYQEEDIRKFSQDKDMVIGCAQVEDKFGDNGITGVFIIRKDNQAEWTIDVFLLSCRVMGRGVEEGMLGYILQKAKTEGVTKVKGMYIPTAKNKPCENFLSSYGFKKERDYWVYYLDTQVKIPPHLTIMVS